MQQSPKKPHSTSLLHQCEKKIDTQEIGSEVVKIMVEGEREKWGKTTVHTMMVSIQ